QVAHAIIHGRGEMAEWSKAPDSKSGIRQRIGGSNPSLSAIGFPSSQVRIVVVAATALRLARRFRWDHDANGAERSAPSPARVYACRSAPTTCALATASCKVAAPGRRRGLHDPSRTPRTLHKP